MLTSPSNHLIVSRFYNALFSFYHLAKIFKLIHLKSDTKALSTHLSGGIVSQLVDSNDLSNENIMIVVAKIIQIECHMLLYKRVMETIVVEQE